MDWELEGGTGRLSGAQSLVARVAMPGFAVVDTDATLLLTFEDPANQGAGLYVRQNGGALMETNPGGEGYEIYVEGSGQQTLGVWREVGGVEEQIGSLADPIPGGLQPDITYALRFQCVQDGGVTDLRVKVWPAGQAEPPGWMIDMEDDAPSLQDTPGSFALDLYNYGGTGSVYFDDVVIVAP
jgi:hypothetical protein